MTWERLLDESSGNAYYYNTETEITQWEFPLDVLEQVLDKLGWSRVVSEENQVYYYSESLGQSSWDLPEGVLEGARGVLGIDVTLSEITGVSEQGNEEEEEEKRNEEGDQDEEMKLDNTATTANDILGLKSIEDTANTKEEPKEEPEELTFDQRKEMFFELLKESNVDSNWSFSMVIKQLISDKRYWIVEDPLSRQQLFEVYLIKKADADFEQSSKKSEEYKEEFFKLLKSKNVVYYSRWKTVSHLLLDEEVYKSIPEKFKVQFFNEYVDSLRADHNKEANSKKEKEIKQLTSYLTESLDISSEFDKCLPYLRSEFPNLSKIELLTQFDKVVTKKEQEMKLIYTEQQKLNYTSDRRARDAFKRVVMKVDRSSQLKWVEFLSAVRDLPEFIELCGHDGSSAIEYYWDIIDEENLKLKSNRDLIRDELVKRNESIDKLNLEHFKTFVKNISTIQHINMKDIELIYKQLGSNTKVKRVNPTYDQSLNKRFKQY